MYAQITDSDKVILHSLDSYLRAIQMPTNLSPDQLLIFKEQARWQLYSDIAQRVPRVVSYIMSENLETNQTALGLYKSLYHHCLDPKFVDIVMQQLLKTNNANDNAIVGAFMAKIVSKYLDQKEAEMAKAKADEKPKKGEKPTHEPKEQVNMDGSEVAHLYDAVKKLLGSMANAVSIRCGNLDEGDALSIAACIAMNSQCSITEIINSNMSVTADVFDILENPSEVIRGALLLKKSDFTKLTTEQDAFIQSLKRWVYRRLNQLNTQVIYQFLVSAYGTMRLDKDQANKYLIFLKDCGTNYSNLLIVAKQIING